MENHEYRYRYGGNGGNFLMCLVFSMVVDDEICDCMKMAPNASGIPSTQKEILKEVNTPHYNT